jgi:hypothetical protein
MTGRQTRNKRLDLADSRLPHASPARSRSEEAARRGGPPDRRRGQSPETGCGVPAGWSRPSLGSGVGIFSCVFLWGGRDYRAVAGEE